MKSALLLLTLVCTVIASPQPWHHHGRKHHKLHHKQHKKSSSSSPSPIPSSLSSLSSSSSHPSVAATSSSSFSTSTSSKLSSTASVGRPSSPSIKPTTRRNSTTLVASTGSPSRVLTGTSSRPSGTGTATHPPSSSTTSAATEGTPCPDFLRGVNIGGWLLLDTTLNANLLGTVQATTQWAFDSAAETATTLSDHWASYFTEADMQDLKSYGINAIKIPIGYWAWDNSGTPYKKGADAYLEKAVGWAAKAGIKVWIDVSNTDTTAPTTAEVSADYAMNHSIEILTKIATKYGASAYSNTVVAIEIFTCPIGVADGDATTHDTYTKKAYSAIRKASTNPNLQVVIPDKASTPANIVPMAKSLSSTKGMFSAAESMSELTCPCEQEMTQVQHIQRACENGYSIAGLNHDDISIYVGDFSPATNATMNVEGWTEDVVTDVRKYVEANLEVFESYTSGYFFWSWAQDSEEVAGVGWGFKAGITKGYIPYPLNDPAKRKYPGQCDA